MRVAFAGKGGSGKTTVSGTTARVLADEGYSVIAVDGDANPNLGTTLGLPRDAFDQGSPLTRDLLRINGDNRGGSVATLARPLTDIINEHAVDGPDSIRLLTMGRAEEAGSGCMCGNHAAVRVIIRELSSSDQMVVLDMEASPEHMTRASTEHVDHMLLVAEPYFKSLETARRYHRLAVDLGIPKVSIVANKIRPGDEDIVAEYCDSHGFNLIATIPYEPRFAEAERLATAPFDVAGDSPGVEAIRGLVKGLLAS
jgi:CO dehydrogenase maturation factor